MSTLIILAVIGLIIYFNLINYQYDKNLFENKISAKVTKVEHHNRGGYKYFYNNSFFWGITFSPGKDSIELAVGDSLFKSSNSLELKVYKKINSNNYKYIKTYFGDND